MKQTNMKLYRITWHEDEDVTDLENKYTTYQAGLHAQSALRKFCKRHRNHYNGIYFLTIKYIKPLREIKNWQDNSVIFL